MDKELVVLVNEKDEKIGLMEKMEAHKKALLHRAFSVFVFNDAGEVMIQQRALSKYHSPGLWANTCCSHPRDKEDILMAGKRRLREEMGFETELKHSTSFIYKASFDNGLTEHEFDHILMGHYNDPPRINKEEVADWKWISLEDLKEDIHRNPEIFAAWFKIIFEKYYDFIAKA